MPDGLVHESDEKLRAHFLHTGTTSATGLNGSRLGRVMVECTLFMTHCLRLNLQPHTISLVRTCRISSFCTVAWQLARLLLTRRIAQSLGDSWASCLNNTINPRNLTQSIISCYTHKVKKAIVSLHPTYRLLCPELEPCLHFWPTILPKGILFDDQKHLSWCDHRT